MLKILRKYSRHWVIGVIIGAIVVVFIFWGMGGFKSPQSQEVATLYGQPIPVTTYVHYVALLEKKSRFRRELSEEDAKALRENALNSLITLTLLNAVAHRLGLSVSDAEVQAAILQDPDFQLQGAFDPRLYDFFVGGRGRPGEKVEFENWVRQQVLAAKVVEAVTSLAKVSEAELQEYFRLAREAVQVDYLVVSPEAFLSRVHPSDAELKGYYEQHQAEFRTPEKVKVRYVLCRSEDFVKQVEVSPKQVENYLIEHSKELMRPKAIQVREIFLALPPKATAADRQKLEKKAKELLQQARQGQDFTELAKRDQTGGKQEGDLGLITRGQRDPAWEKVAFSLEPGQLGLAQTAKGFHLIKLEEVTEREPRPEAEAKALALKKITGEKSRNLAQDEAKRLQAEMARAAFLEVAQRNKVNPQDTPFFTRTEPIPGLGAVRAFNEEAFKLKPREVGLAEVPQGFALLQVLERQPEALPPFEQARDRVRQVLARQQAKKMAEKEAEILLARLQQGEPLARVAAQAALPLKSSGYFSRLQGFLHQPLAEPLTSAAFQVGAPQPYPAQPIFWQGKYYLLAFKHRRLPPPEEFQKERERLEQQVLQDKRRMLFEAWLKEEWQRAQVSKPKESSQG